MLFSSIVLRKILPPAGLACAATYAAIVLPSSSTSLRPMHGGTPLLMDNPEEEGWNPMEVWFPV